jgi:CRISPR/Cas system-associated exonuclease Cas4 (RecB family)
MWKEWVGVAVDVVQFYKCPRTGQVREKEVAMHEMEDGSETQSKGKVVELQDVLQDRGASEDQSCS